MPVYRPEDGYLIGVRIYWSKFADNGLTFEQNRWVIKKGGISGQSHTLNEVWYQDYIYNLIPEEINKMKNGEDELITVSQWKFNEENIKCIRKVMLEKKKAPYIYSVPWPVGRK